MDSKELIGNPKLRYDELIHKHFEWHSFYNGWLEGRVDMYGNGKDGYCNYFIRQDSWFSESNIKLPFPELADMKYCSECGKKIRKIFE